MLFPKHGVEIVFQLKSSPDIHRKSAKEEAGGKLGIFVQSVYDTSSHKETHRYFIGHGTYRL